MSNKLIDLLAQSKRISSSGSLIAATAVVSSISAGAIAQEVETDEATSTLEVVEVRGTHKTIEENLAEVNSYNPRYYFGIRAKL